MLNTSRPILLVLALVMAACGSPEEETQLQCTDSQMEWVTMESGLRYADIVECEGEEAQAGMKLAMHYTGWLYDETAAENKGSQFDSSRDRNVTFDFVLGTGNVIKGWDQGLVGMKPGGRRMLIIPSDLGYGDAGRGPIPGGATMLFDVELVAFR